MTTMTTAEQIAERLGNNGSVFWVAPLPGEQGQEHEEGFSSAHDGQVSLNQIATAAGGRREQRPAHSSDEYRYLFADGSVITVCGGGWDLGYAGCWCWQGAGHSENCEAEARLEPARAGA